MDDDSILLSFCDEMLEILFEMLDHIRADGMCLLTFFAPIRQRCERCDPPAHPAFRVRIQGDL